MPFFYPYPETVFCGGDTTDGYITLKNEAYDEFEVKHSRFIGYAKPVATQEEAVEFINSIRSKHWDAAHNVYAYILRDGQSRRYSDDGEPQGTAGMPVLDVLLKENITDCVVVATRYFGGIMLGAGGLVRAYSHTAKIAVDAAVKIMMRQCSIMTCSCDYNFYGRLSSLIPENGGTVENTDFSDKVTVEFSVPTENEGMFLARLTDAGNGKYHAEKVTERFMSADL